MILSSENLLHLAEWMEDIRENQCEPPKNVSAGFLGIIKENEAWNAHILKRKQQIPSIYHSSQTIHSEATLYLQYN